MQIVTYRRCMRLWSRQLHEGALAIRLRCAGLPVVDDRSADAILGYDDRGLPA